MWDSWGTIGEQLGDRWGIAWGQLGNSLGTIGGQFGDSWGIVGVVGGKTHIRKKQDVGGVCFLLFVHDVAP